MPSNIPTEADELQLEVIAEDEVVDGSQDSGNAEGETEDNPLNLETEEQADGKQLTAAEQNAKKQEEVWLGKVISEKSNVEDAPTWLQSRLNARLEAMNKVPETEEVVRQVLAKERDAQEFKTLQAEIPKLSPAQAKQLQDKFAELKPLGNVKALRTALDLMGLSQKMKEAEQRGVAKGRISLPKSGQPAVRKSEQSVGNVPMSVVEDNKAWLNMIKNAGQQD